VTRSSVTPFGSLTILAVLLVAATAWSLFLMRWAPSRLYVACGEVDRVAIVDCARHELMGHLATDDSPEELLVGANGWKLYVACRASRTIQVFDTATRRLLTRYVLEREPGQMQVDEVRGVLEVSHVGGGPHTVLQLETDALMSLQPKTVTSPISTTVERTVARFSGQVTAEIVSRVSLPDPNVFLGVSPLVPELLVTDQTTFWVRRRIPVGQGPCAMVQAPRGGKAYVALRGEDAVAVVDTDRLEVTGRVPVGRGPARLLEVNGGREMYVMNTDGGSLTVLRLDNDSVVKTIEVGGHPFGSACWPPNRPH